MNHVLNLFLLGSALFWLTVLNHKIATSEDES